MKFVQDNQSPTLFEYEVWLDDGTSVTDVVACPKAAQALAWMHNHWLPSFETSEVESWTFCAFQPRWIEDFESACPTKYEVLASNDDQSINVGIGRALEWDKSNRKPKYCRYKP